MQKITAEQVRQQLYVANLLPKGSKVLRGQKDLKVDLGCGRSKTPDHIGFDCIPGSNYDFACDLNQGIPLEDSCCSAVVAGHFLEHVKDPEFMVYEIWRVCQPDALVKINVPSVSWEGAFAIEHESFLPLHFFNANRAFRTLFRIERYYYQYDQKALEVARKYLPEITDEDAGLLFTNVRRQLLIEARPRPETKEAPSSAS